MSKLLRARRRAARRRLRLTANRSRCCRRASGSSLLGSNAITLGNACSDGDLLLDWLLDAYGSVWFFTENPEFFWRNQYVPGVQAQTQDPVAVLETHLSYDVRPRFWLSLDANFRRGGATSLNGVENEATLQQNSRVGITGAFPVTRGSAGGVRRRRKRGYLPSMRALAVFRFSATPCSTPLFTLPMRIPESIPVGGSMRVRKRFIR